MTRTPTKKTSPRRRNTGILVANLLRKFDKDKPAKPNDIRLKIMSKFQAKTTTSGIKITKNRYTELGAEGGSSSSSEEAREQRTPRRRRGEKEKNTGSMAESMDTTKTSKRPREEEEVVLEDLEGDAGIEVAQRMDGQRDKMKKILEAAGVKDPKVLEQMNLLMDETFTLIKEVFTKAFMDKVRQEVKVMIDQSQQEMERKRAEKEVRNIEVQQVTINEQVEKAMQYEKCNRSLIVYNADKLVSSVDRVFLYGADWGLAASVSTAIYRMSNGMVTCNDAYTMGRWQQGKPPTTVVLVLESPRMKGTLFRILAARIRSGDDNNGRLKQVSIRDMFPRERLNDARREVRRGMVLKRKGRIVTFKVVSRGLGCIPVLEVKTKSDGGVVGGWEIFQSSMLTQEQRIEVENDLLQQDMQRQAEEQARQDKEDELYMNEI